MLWSKIETNFMQQSDIQVSNRVFQFYSYSNAYVIIYVDKLKSFRQYNLKSLVCDNI